MEILYQSNWYKSATAGGNIKPSYTYRLSLDIVLALFTRFTPRYYGLGGEIILQEVHFMKLFLMGLHTKPEANFKIINAEFSMLHI